MPTTRFVPVPRTTALTQQPFAQGGLPHGFTTAADLPAPPRKGTTAGRGPPPPQHQVPLPSQGPPRRPAAAAAGAGSGGGSAQDPTPEGTTDITAFFRGGGLRHDGGGVPPLSAEAASMLHRRLGIERFNRVQRRCAPAAFFSTGSLVIVAPTATGKTAVLELALMRQFLPRLLSPATAPAQDCGKAVYVAPIKALAAEKQRVWQQRFPELSVVLETGDTQHQPTPTQTPGAKGQGAGQDLGQDDDLGTAERADIVVTTPERWDAITRRWRQGAANAIVAATRTLLIDEVHVLGEERGAVLEAIVSRMKTVNAERRAAAARAGALGTTAPAAAPEGQQVGAAKAPPRRVTFADDSSGSGSAAAGTPPSPDPGPGGRQPQARADGRADGGAAEIRFVAASGTVSNADDIAAWLGAGPGHLLRFTTDDREVKLATHVVSFPSASQNPFQFARFLTYKLPAVIDRHAAANPALVFCCSRQDVVATAHHMANEAGAQLLQQAAADLTRPGGAAQRVGQRQYATAQEVAAALQAGAGRVEDAGLRRCIPRGVGFHNAGLSPGDRATVEELFSQRLLRVVCTTSTLALGVNLPARLVVVKGTAAAGPAQGPPPKRCGGLRSAPPPGQGRELPVADVAQMCGRAGRPGLDTEGVAVVLTSDRQATAYRGLQDAAAPGPVGFGAGAVRRQAAPSQPPGAGLCGGLHLPPVESRLHERLVEHLNAEVVLGTLPTVATAVRWLRTTFLWVRLQRDPQRYGVAVEKASRRLALVPSDAAADAAVLADHPSGATVASTATRPEAAEEGEEGRRGTTAYALRLVNAMVRRLVQQRCVAWSSTARGDAADDGPGEDVEDEDADAGPRAEGDVVLDCLSATDPDGSVVLAPDAALAPTSVGRLMAKFYLSFDTVAALNGSLGAGACGEAMPAPAPFPGVKLRHVRGGRCEEGPDVTGVLTGRAAFPAAGDADLEDDPQAHGGSADDIQGSDSDGGEHGGKGGGKGRPEPSLLSPQAMLALVCRCPDLLQDCRLRCGDKQHLNAMNRSKSTCRFPIKNGTFLGDDAGPAAGKRDSGQPGPREVKEPWHKPYVLLQAALAAQGSLTAAEVPDPGVRSDSMRAIAAAPRLAKAVSEYAALTGKFHCAVHAWRVLRALERRMWWDAPCQTRQLDGVGPALAAAMQRGGVGTVPQLAAADPRRVEALVGRQPPFGTTVRDKARGAALPYTVSMAVDNGGGTVAACSAGAGGRQLLNPAFTAEAAMAPVVTRTTEVVVRVEAEAPVDAAALTRRTTVAATLLVGCVQTGELCLQRRVRVPASPPLTSHTFTFNVLRSLKHAGPAPLGAGSSSGAAGHGGAGSTTLTFQAVLVAERYLGCDVAATLTLHRRPQDVPVFGLAAVQEQRAAAKETAAREARVAKEAEAKKAKRAAARKEASTPGPARRQGLGQVVLKGKAPEAGGRTATGLPAPAAEVEGSSDDDDEERSDSGAESAGKVDVVAPPTTVLPKKGTLHAALAPNVAKTKAAAAVQAAYEALQLKRRPTAAAAPNVNGGAVPATPAVPSPAGAEASRSPSTALEPEMVRVLQGVKARVNDNTTPCTPARPSAPGVPAAPSSAAASQSSDASAGVAEEAKGPTPPSAPGSPKAGPKAAAAQFLQRLLASDSDSPGQSQQRDQPPTGGLLGRGAKAKAAPTKPRQDIRAGVLTKKRPRATEALAFMASMASSAAPAQRPLHHDTALHHPAAYPAAYGAPNAVQGTPLREAPYAADPFQADDPSVGCTGQPGAYQAPWAQQQPQHHHHHQQQQQHNPQDQPYSAPYGSPPLPHAAAVGGGAAPWEGFVSPPMGPPSLAAGAAQAPFFDALPPGPFPGPQQHYQPQHYQQPQHMPMPYQAPPHPYSHALYHDRRAPAQQPAPFFGHVQHRAAGPPPATPSAQSFVVMPDGSRRFYGAVGGVHRPAARPGPAQPPRPAPSAQYAQSPQYPWMG